MRWRLGLAALLLAANAMSAWAQTPVAPVPEGLPRAGGELLDREFGVETGQFGLDRRVEMYQWLRVGQDRYEPAWKAAWVDSSEFAPGHENPPELPLESRRWWAGQPTLDDRPLDPSVLKALGQWQPFRPGFSRLPGNLAATFQPEGDGLISSENPLDPRIGDLRVSWRELVLPPLAGKVVLRDGTWRLAPRSSAPVTARSDRPGDPATAAKAPIDQARAPRWPWLLATLVVGLLVLLLKRRRLRR